MMKRLKERLVEIDIGDLKYNFLFGSSLFISGFLLLLLLIWANSFQTGFTKIRPNEFTYLLNWHQTLMFTSFVVVTANSMLVHKLTFISESKRKKAHLSLNIFALIVGTVGLVYALVFHQRTNQSHLYSVHSWIGLFSYQMFFIQIAFGLCVYLSKGHQETIATVKKYHAFFGTLLFILMAITVTTGVTERGFLFSGIKYEDKTADAKLLNSFALLNIFYIAAVIAVSNFQ